MLPTDPPLPHVPTDDAAVREREARYRALFARIDQGFCVCAMIVDAAGAPVDYRFVEINDAFVEMTGLPADAVGRTAREMVPALEQHWVDTYARVGLGGESLHFESSSLAMGRSFDVFATPVPPHGHFALVFTDVTARRQAEAALQTRERHTRLLADTAPAILWVTDADHRLGFISRGWYLHTGLTSDDIEGTELGWFRAVHPDERAAVRDEFLRHASAREPVALEYRQAQADGSWRFVLDTGHPRVDEDGHWLGYIGSIVDVHERVQSREALREAGRRKDEFLAVLAHELRNPLAPIRTGLDILRRGEADPAAARTVWPMMARQVDHMVRLVDDLLDVSRLSTGRIELQRRPVPLRDIVSNAVDANRAAIESRHQILTLDVPDVTVDVDPTRFLQVLSNLLHNAAKFTSGGGRIDLQARLDATAGRSASLTVTVRDDGEGIDEALLAHVFEPFAQGPAHGASGLGIGLALARQLAELHGGTIDVASDGPGRGSCFTVCVPMEQVSLHASDEVAATAALPAGRRVLVVDDNQDAADGMAMLIELMGVAVRVAYDGRNALATAEAFRPDLVLLDLGMPVVDGYDVCRTLRQQPGGEALSIVALTGWGQESDRRRTHEAGFDDHLTKPIEPAQVERLLAEPPRRRGKA
jgi:PAS domain S-box-containing protein